MNARALLWRAVTAALLLALLAVAAGWWTLRASLPATHGERRLAGLGAGVTVTRDAAGVPTLRAAHRADLARALGFVHGQDRFFQMDLMRRVAAGELAALLGPGLIGVDERYRVHRFRDVARRAVAALAAPDRALLQAYVEGVNAGLGALGSRPFEYWLLRTAPRPWTAEDTLLCVHAMFIQLQDAAGRGQLQRGLLRATLPAPLWRLLEAGAPEWDATIDGSRDAEPVLPSAAEVDLRRAPALPVLPPARMTEQLALLGSNNWAVSGALTGNGAALLANDMHLGYRVPIIWYRARLVLDGEAAFDATGVTLPGAPTIVAGSNGAIAWGFTDSYGEFATVVRLVPVPGDAQAYLTADGPRHFTYVDERIEVKGAPSRSLRIAQTPWGPVLGKDWEGRPYALQWTAADPQAANLRLMDLEQIRDAAQALRAAPTFGMPAQNFLVADAAGHIGWTLAGKLPARLAGAHDLPQLSTDPAIGWRGWLDPRRQPRVLDPPQGLLWSANARVVGGEAAELIGDDGMDRGARAAQIHADLTAAPRPVTPRARLAVQLADRAEFLARWRELLAGLLERTRAGGDMRHEAARRLLGTWSGHAAPEDAAYRLVNLFRAQVEVRAFTMLIAPARQRAADFEFEVPSSFEGPLWRLLQARPENLLAAHYANWDAFLLEALSAAETLPGGCAQLSDCDWGRVNAVHIAHPLSRALPFAARWLDMPTVRIAGGRKDMPRIQGPDYGASERFSVSPGHEREGYFHMPGGQSGHPLSPYYRAGFADWAQGRASPFLPGPPREVLTLLP